MPNNFIGNNISENEERNEREWPPGVNKTKKVEKPWGYELIWARTNSYGGKILHIEKGYQLSIQYHKIKDETMYVQNGLIELHVGDVAEDMEKIKMSPGQSFRIVPGKVHSVIAIETSDILEVSTAHYDDIVRLNDKYGRE